MPENVDNLPIDIHSNKLLDWLVDRRHCKRDWQQSVLPIREKIAQAIQDMPAVDEITELVKGSHINYFHCLRIVELLRETEASSRNIFGGYSSRRMKDWQEIVKLYEKDDCGLAEAAQMLMRNVMYEVPSLKKQITKCGSVQEETVRKEAEYANQAKHAKEDYINACKQIGIEGKKVKRELVALLDTLPKAYEEMAAECRGLMPARDFYREFAAYTSGAAAKSRLEDGSGDTNESATDGDKNELLGMLKYVQEHGNTTLYEWKTGQAPKSIEVPKLDIEVEKDDDEDEDELDFGDDLDLNVDDGAEDLDFDMCEGTDDIVDLEVVDASSLGPETAGGGESSGQDVEGSVTKEVAALLQSGVARGSDAKTLLDVTQTRNLFLDDLWELRSFLTQRLAELRGSGKEKVQSDVIASVQAASLPQQLSVAQLESHLATCVGLIGRLTEGKIMHLYMIHTSPRYVDRLVLQLQQKLWTEEKAAASQRLCVEKREASVEEEARLRPQLVRTIHLTKYLQTQIQNAISKKYKNRPVNIMGNINLM